MIRILAASALVLCLAACSKGGATSAASTGGAQPVALLLKDHKFTPAEITVPAHQAFAIEVTNADAVADEFDSDSLKREKVIAGGQKGTVRIGPLDPGRYPFMGEYHAKTAQGVVIVK